MPAAGTFGLCIQGCSAVLDPCAFLKCENGLVVSDQGMCLALSTLFDMSLLGASHQHPDHCFTLVCVHHLLLYVLTKLCTTALL